MLHLNQSGADIPDGNLMAPAPPQEAGNRVQFTSDFPWALFMDEPLDQP
jgi:hypothetical protein